ncbi:hypothetical protein IAE36_003110 [Pseudomonas sp. S36]|nr:hypothetical protein [Pseudomonas sp. S36]
MDPATLALVATVLAIGSAFLSIVIKTIQLRNLIKQERKK